MKLYKLTTAEIEIINTINKQNGILGVNILMIICDHGYGEVISYDDLQLAPFNAYFAIIKSGTQKSRIVEVNYV